MELLIERLKRSAAASRFKRKGDVLVDYGTLVNTIEKVDLRSNVSKTKTRVTQLR